MVMLMLTVKGDMEQNRFYNTSTFFTIEANEYSYRGQPIDKVDFDAVLSHTKTNEA